MNDVLKFINQIPAFICAKEPEQLRYLLNKAYTDELLEKTRVFSRETDRFFIIKTWKVKGMKGFLRKRHVLKLLDIMNVSHKLKDVPNDQKDKVSRNLNKSVKSADRKTTTLSMNGTQAKAAYWG